MYVVWAKKQKLTSLSYLKLVQTVSGKHFFHNYLCIIRVSWGHKKKRRAHTDLNHGPLDLQSNALPLSYTPMTGGKAPSKKLGWTEAGAAKSFVRCGIRTHALIRGPEFSWQLCIAEQGNPWVWRLRPLGQPDMLSLTPNFFHLIFSRLKPNKTDRAQDRTGDLLRVKQTW